MYFTKFNICATTTTLKKKANRFKKEERETDHISVEDGGKSPSKRLKTTKNSLEADDLKTASLVIKIQNKYKIILERLADKRPDLTIKRL